MVASLTLEVNFVTVNSFFPGDAISQCPSPHSEILIGVGDWKEWVGSSMGRFVIALHEIDNLRIFEGAFVDISITKCITIKNC